MLAVKAEYENGQVRWLEKPPVAQPQDVIVVFQMENDPAEHLRKGWMNAQSEALEHAWDNDEDADYDQL
ncbi:MAG: hypothetical protein PHP44_04120 [Kiritimatiellae bacterium]|nr:hypothetical protein [Kiritimatiellia bacterium]